MVTPRAPLPDREHPFRAPVVPVPPLTEGRVPGNDTRFALAVITVGAIWATLWLGACASASLSGHSIPHPSPDAPPLVLARPGDPQSAWGVPVGPPGLYWSVTLLTF